MYGIPLILIILFGQLRLSFDSENQTVRIASVNISKSDLENRINSYTDSLIDKSNNSFLSNCEIAITSGANIVFGAETEITLNEDNEELFINKAKIIARKNNIYLGLPMAVILKGFPQVRPENKIIWISPKGEILFEYHKAKPTPGEGDYGDGILKYFDSPYGRISSAICFDMDFPSFIRQVNDMNIDIMLVPGNDWKEISPYHTYVSSARAIEQGFNMVRATSRGLSASFDYKGKLLSYQDFYNTDNVILYSDLPVKGTKTIYSKFGDYFAWLCILLFLSISFLLIKKTWINDNRD
jgi:apolipoprotein N-acyltransferase